MKRRLITFIITFFCAVSLWAQNDEARMPKYRFRLQLTDKQGSSYSLDHPEAFLSQRALERRKRQGLKIDSTDLPVSDAYLNAIRSKGVRIHCVSKWNNLVLVEVDDSLKGVALQELPYVRSSLCTWIEPQTTISKTKDRKQQVVNAGREILSPYGDAYWQCAMMGGYQLHEAGFRGANMTIAVIDAGFYNADVIKAFRKSRILGTHDFVNPGNDVYAENSHGMKVFSCMAANRPHVMLGTAPEASYWLLRSEDNDSEQPAEMDYWAAAIEFADSVGVDVVNTSLGYNSFNNKVDNLSYWQLDGESTLISRAASQAAGKGILVVCSAGNAGNETWKKITPPGDAKDVLTVGAVDRTGVNMAFSSVGNTADGRIKPDVCAMGGFSTVIGGDGSLERGNGTSYAAPILCGLAACLWQALPQLTVPQLIHLIKSNGNNKEHPDNIYGYGVPDFWKAYQEAKP